jgi:hypothetical protein
MLNDFMRNVVAWFAELGFVMKVETPVYKLEHIEFCQSHPVEVAPGVYRMVRDPRVVLDKDLIVLKPIQHKSDYDFYRRAIGLCGLSLAGDVPVFNQFYSALVRGTVASNRVVELESGMQYLAMGMKQKFSEPTATARVSFCEAFGIPPDLQEALEGEYSRVTLQWSTPDCVLGFGNLIAGLT